MSFCIAASKVLEHLVLLTCHQPLGFSYLMDEKSFLVVVLICIFLVRVKSSIFSNVKETLHLEVLPSSPYLAGSTLEYEDERERG